MRIYGDTANKESALMEKWNYSEGIPILPLYKRRVFPQFQEEALSGGLPVHTARKKIRESSPIGRRRL
jgi:hypothetical protein